MLDPKLIEFVSTDKQREYLTAVITHGGLRPAARALGVDRRSIERAIEATKKRAVVQGHSPEHDMTHIVPSPYVVKGTSTLYRGDGTLAAQWVKTRVSDALLEQHLKNLVAHLVEDARGLCPPIKLPTRLNKDLLSVYPMGDPHFGMYAWAKECGEDFDVEEAERLTFAAVDRLVETSPPSETALIVELGDMFHADSSIPLTVRSQAVLDVDTRWARVVQIGLRALIHCIKRCLQKHKQVTVRINKGNHDPHSSFALALALDAYFSNNSRVRIDLSPAQHWYFRHGKVLIGSTHGDTNRARELPGIMATDRPQDWGETKHRYWYCGHVHHTEHNEYPGCVVEYFRTLAARDAWHSGEGYRAGRDMRLIVHHTEHGEVERHRCDVGMLS